MRRRSNQVILEIMVRYVYAWLPVVALVATAVLLTIPYLALIALLVVVVVALAAVASAIAWTTRLASRAVSRSRRNRKHATSEAFLLHAHATDR